MDNLTSAVLATITSDGEMSKRALTIARSMPWRPTELNFQTAERIGSSIATEIGERLSLRFDGAVPKDQIHDCLWQTFMGHVDWTEVGKYYLENYEESHGRL